MKIDKGFFIPLFFLVASCSTEYVATQPEEQVIVQTPAPGTGYLFRGPEWKWDLGQKTYIYVPGAWEKHPSGIWVRGHWRHTGKGYVWVPGHWQ